MLLSSQRSPTTHPTCIERLKKMPLESSAPLGKAIFMKKLTLKFNFIGQNATPSFHIAWSRFLFDIKWLHGLTL